MRRARLAILISLTFVSSTLAREATTRPAEASVEFLTQEQARAAIVDESMEPYFKLLQPMEMSVKTAAPIGDGTLEQQRDRCRKRYQAAVESFTPEEEETLRWYVSRLAPKVAREYPLYAQTHWSFLKLSPRFEGGMPHTRGAHIVVSAGVVGMLTAARKHAPEWAALAQGADILLHEQSHVVQREHPREMARLYTGFWKFEHPEAVQGCDWLTRHQLVNPDGVDVRWVFPIHEGQKTRWIWPLIVFGDVADPGAATFADMRMIGVDVEPASKGVFKAKLQPDGTPLMQDLMGITEFASAFLGSQNIYHPNEAAADLFAKGVIVDKLLPASLTAGDPGRLATAQKKLQPLNAWFVKVLAKAPAPR
jgi:hypothetical protein